MKLVPNIRNKAAYQGTHTRKNNPQKTNRPISKRPMDTDSSFENEDDGEVLNLVSSSVATPAKEDSFDAATYVSETDALEFNGDISLGSPLADSSNKFSYLFDQTYVKGLPPPQNYNKINVRGGIIETNTP